MAKPPQSHQGQTFSLLFSASLSCTLSHHFLTSSPNYCFSLLYFLSFIRAIIVTLCSLLKTACFNACILFCVCASTVIVIGSVVCFFNVNYPFFFCTIVLPSIMYINITIFPHVPPPTRTGNPNISLAVMHLALV